MDADASRRYIYPSMLSKVRNAILDRTNRGGSVQSGRAESAFAESVAYSESSGSEAANDRLLESPSSSQSSMLPPVPDGLDPGPDHVNAVHHESEDESAHGFGRCWHFTQYIHRQFQQHKDLNEPYE